MHQPIKWRITFNTIEIQKSSTLPAGHKIQRITLLCNFCSTKVPGRFEWKKRAYKTCEAASQNQALVGNGSQGMGRSTWLLIGCGLAWWRLCFTVLLFNRRVRACLGTDKYRWFEEQRWNDYKVIKVYWYRGGV